MRTKHSRTEVSLGRVPSYRAHGFTLVELLVVIAIIALLAAILFPVFSRARENARRTSCMSNVRQMCMGMKMYTQDFDERLPVDRSNICVEPNTAEVAYALNGSSSCPTGYIKQYWADLIEAYVKNSQIFNDPSAVNRYFAGCRFFDAANAPCVTPNNSRFKPYIYQGRLKPAIDLNFTPPILRNDREGIGYGYTQRLGNPSYNSSAAGQNGFTPNMRFPSETLLIAESSRYVVSPPTTLPSSKGGEVIPRHFDGVVVGFVDGHAKWMKWQLVVAIPSAPNATAASKKLWYPEYTG